MLFCSKPSIAIDVARKNQGERLGFVIGSSFVAMMGTATGVDQSVITVCFLMCDPALCGGIGEFVLPWLRLCVIFLAITGAIFNKH